MLRYIEIFGLLALSAVAGGLLWAEQSTFRATGNPDFSNPAVVLAQIPEHPLSLRASRAALLFCDDAMAVVQTAFQTRTSRQDVAARCRSLAAKIVRLTPTDSLAYLVAARAENYLDNWDLARANLALSAEFAPFEGWLAERRFVFAVNSLNGALSADQSVDIRTLLTTQSGAELLADYYQSRPELRLPISAMAGQAGEPDQVRFLNLLKKARQT